MNNYFCNIQLRFVYISNIWKSSELKTWNVGYTLHTFFCQCQCLFEHLFSSQRVQGDAVWEYASGRGHTGLHRDGNSVLGQSGIILLQYYNTPWQELRIGRFEHWRTNNMKVNNIDIHSNDPNCWVASCNKSNKSMRQRGWWLVTANVTGQSGHGNTQHSTQLPPSPSG